MQKSIKNKKITCRQMQCTCARWFKNASTRYHVLELHYGLAQELRFSSHSFMASIGATSRLNLHRSPSTMEKGLVERGE